MLREDWELAGSFAESEMLPILSMKNRLHR